MLKPYIKPPFPYDRPISWSQLSSFKYSPSGWYRSYVLEQKSTSPEMIFGSMVDKQIQEDSNYLPEIKRLTHLQYELKAEFNGLQLLGYPDALDLDNPEIRDYKTGRKPWNKKRADETGQLTMYLLMIYQTLGIKPEEFKCYIDWIPTHIKDKEVCFVEPFSVKTFKTKRTLTDILKFGQFILESRAKMIEYYNKQ